MHAHFDCFSGAAGDMMLAACLDAANSLPYSLAGQQRSSSITAEAGQAATKKMMNSDVLLSILVEDLEGGLPELRGEFDLSVKRVWRGMGRIAAMKVDVHSVYHHEAAPVPGSAPQKEVHESDPYVEHNHKGLKDDPLQHHGGEYNQYHHGHSHNHESVHIHHDHIHNHVNSSSVLKDEPQHNFDNEHNHSHGHSHENGHSNGKLRNLPQITKMLQSAPSYHIPTRVVTLAIEAFTTLAHAEMHTHGATSIDEVHFHEVGAVDSIVDTVGTLLALHYLGVNLGGGEGVDESGDGGCVPVAVTCSPLPLGEGNVWTDHGLLPVPAFAAMRLMIGMPTCPGPKGVTGELVTPTAAALLRVLTGVSSSNSDAKMDPGLFWQPKVVPGRPPPMVPRAVGIGAGSKDFERHPNVMRLILGDITLNTQCSSGSVDIAADTVEVSKSSQDIIHESVIPVKMQRDEATDIIDHGQQCQHLWDMHTLTLLQANIDDATPELLAHAVNLLLYNGAIDAWITPIVMKKGRPAHSLNCIFRCNSADEVRLLTILFRNTTSLGVRIQRNILRAALRRKIVHVQLPYIDNARNGEVDVKISSLTDGEVVSIKAEFDQCKVVSMESGVPLKIVTSMAERLAWDRHITPELNT